MKALLTFTEIEAQAELAQMFKQELGSSGSSFDELSVNIVRTDEANPSPSDVLMVTKLVAQRKGMWNRKIETIRDVRSRCRWGLATAKEFVETIWGPSPH